MTLQDRLVDAVANGRARIPLFVEIAPGVQAMRDAIAWDVREAYGWIYAHDDPKGVSQREREIADCVGMTLEELRDPMGPPYWIRFGATTRTSQRIADLLGATLPSAASEDLVHAASRVKLRAKTYNPANFNIARPTTMILHSQSIDVQIRDAGVSDLEIVSTVGKSWVLDNLIESKPGRVPNYGWHDKASPYRSIDGRWKVWQPLSMAHNLDHADYSQTLRLVKLDEGAVLPHLSASNPIRPIRIPGVKIEAARDTERPPATLAFEEREPKIDPFDPSPENRSREFARRCVFVALAEMKRENPPKAATIAAFHAVAIRNGKPLGITKGNHCASAASWCALQALDEGDRIPHEPRASAKEIMRDAIARGAWVPIVDVRAGLWTPSPGDLAIYDRSVPGKPETAWWGHVDRVVSAGPHAFENIGANEGARGAWVVQWTDYKHARLLGFVDYQRSDAMGLHVPVAEDLDLPFDIPEAPGRPLFR